MSNPLDTNAGKPSLEHLQYLQDNWSKEQISASLQVEVVTFDATTTGTSGVEAENIPVGATIIDVVVHPTASVGSGSARVRVGGGGANITDAIAMATVDTIGRATTIDQTYNVVGSDGIEVISNSDSDRGVVYIYYKK